MFFFLFVCLFVFSPSLFNRNWKAKFSEIVITRHLWSAVVLLLWTELDLEECPILLCVYIGVLFMTKVSTQYQPSSRSLFLIGKTVIRWKRTPTSTTYFNKANYFVGVLLQLTAVLPIINNNPVPPLKYFLNILSLKYPLSSQHLEIQDGDCLLHKDNNASTW